MSTSIEIETVFIAERQRWDNTVIGLFRAIHAADGVKENEHVTVRISAEPGELTPNLSYRLFGLWSDTKYGRQFTAKTFVRSAPHGQAGVMRYLAEAPHIGKSVAQALWNKFGSDAVRIVRETPETAADVVGIAAWSTEKAKQSAVFLKTMASLESCSIELVDLLGGRGFPKSTAKRAIKKWGNKAGEIIRRCPYRLIQFAGCGFKLTDKLYLDLGHPAGKLKRQALCIWHYMDSDSEGHTWHRVEDCMKALRANVSSVEINGPKAVKLARRAGLIRTHRDQSDKLYLGEAMRANSEITASMFLRASRDEPPRWPVLVPADGISEHQYQELSKSIKGVIGILGGSPGTGKTYTAAKLIKTLIDRHGSDRVAVVAPTGKAAVRISESLLAGGVNVAATTVHRLLVVRRTDNDAEEDGGYGGFEHGPGNPVEFDWIIVDESSMLDTTLISALLAARAPHTHMLFIGDVNQLPPVGHGAPLRDMIQAGVPYGELREIQRNSGTIVRACHQIRDNVRFQTEEDLDPDCDPPKNLKIVNVRADLGPAGTIEKLLMIFRNLGLCDPVWEAQVIVAVNEGSPIARVELNKELQGVLNPDGKRAGKNPYRVGDKIVCLKNGYYKGTEHDAEVYLANGEIGKIIDVKERAVEARFELPAGEDGKRRFKTIEFVTFEKTGGNFDLAYALTCHKMQGSEIPVVIVAIDDNAKFVCDRSWVYTAISRAKKVCILVGKRDTVDAMCRKSSIGRRKTFLRERILGEQTARKVEHAKTT